MTVRYSASRPGGREHIPLMPKGFIALRIVQLVLAVIVLGLCGFTLAALALRSNALSTFTSIATMGITIYSIVVEFSRDAWKGYNYWAVLALDIFLLIFWLVSFALTAAEAAVVGDEVFCTAYDCFTMTDVYIACLAAVAGLGGVEFVLFIVSLAMHSVAVHRHRAAGLHCSPGSSSAAAAGDDIPNPHNAIPMGGPVPPQEKQQHHQNQYQQPAPTYTAAVAPDHHQQQQQQHYQQQQPQQQQQHAGAVPSASSSAAMYQQQTPTSSAAVASPQSYYPPQAHQQQQQQQQQPQQVSPVGGHFGGGPVPAEL